SGVGMLAASSNETAQKALVDLYRNVAQTEEKLSILAGVSAGEGKPAPEWKDVFSSELASTAQDSNSAVREASTYALGSAIRKETNEERRRELEGVLWKEISDASTPKARV